MEKKPYESISINEICVQAGLTRPTFYNHFSSKDVVLRNYMDVLFREFAMMYELHRVTSVERLAYDYFSFWKNHASFLQLMANSNLFSLISDCFADYLDTVFDAVPFAPKGISAEERRYHNALLGSGLSGVLKYWAEKDMETDVATLSGYVSHALIIDA